METGVKLQVTITILFTITLLFIVNEISHVNGVKKAEYKVIEYLNDSGYDEKDIETIYALDITKERSKKYTVSVIFKKDKDIEYVYYLDEKGVGETVKVNSSTEPLLE